MANQLETCLNCEKQFDDSFEFCPYCGQQANEKLTFKVLFYNTISNYFSYDARFFKSFFPLLLKPGHLAKNFVEGKRLLYLHPARMYLFVSILFFFLFSVFFLQDQVESFDKNVKNTFTTADSLRTNQNNIEQVIDSIKKDSVFSKALEEDIPEIGQAAQELDSLIKNGTTRNQGFSIDFGFDESKIDSLIEVGASDEEILKTMGMEESHNFFVKKFYRQWLKFYKQRDGGQVLKAFYDAIPIALFVLLPIFALLLKIFFYRRGRYAHHLVFSLYFFSFLFTVFNILLLLNQVVAIPVSLNILLILSTFFYLLLSVKRFYEKGFIVSFLKSSMVAFVFLLIVIPIAILIVGAVTFMFY